MARDAMIRAARQALIDWWKLTHGCENCGYGLHADDWFLYRQESVALDFDHRDPGMKVTAVSRMADPRRGYTGDEFATEIGKCRILCSNCHRIKTAADRERARRQAA